MVIPDGRVSGVEGGWQCVDWREGRGTEEGRKGRGKKGKKAKRREGTKQKGEEGKEREDRGRNKGVTGKKGK
jgi:hypothetical protein